MTLKTDDTQPSQAIRNAIEEMGKTQKTKAVRRDEPKPQTQGQKATVAKEVNPEPQNPKFGWGSFGLLLFLVWTAETFGTVFPGPIDDLVWDLIASLFFGLVQYIRLKLPMFDLYLKKRWQSVWSLLKKKYPKLTRDILFYLGRENEYDEKSK